MRGSSGGPRFIAQIIYRAGASQRLAQSRPSKAWCREYRTPDSSRTCPEKLSLKVDQMPSPLHTRDNKKRTKKIDPIPPKKLMGTPSPLLTVDGEGSQPNPHAPTKKTVYILNRGVTPSPKKELWPQTHLKTPLFSARNPPRFQGNSSKKHKNREFFQVFVFFAHTSIFVFCFSRKNAQSSNPLGPLDTHRGCFYFKTS